MKIVIKTTNIKLTPILKAFIEKKINSLEKFSKIFYSKPSRRISTRFSERKPNIAERVEISLLSKEYYNHFFGKGKPKIEAWVEVERTTFHHKKGPFFRAECQMRFPGKTIRSEATAKNLKVAINEIKNDLRRAIKEYKEKITIGTKKDGKHL